MPPGSLYEDERRWETRFKTFADMFDFEHSISTGKRHLDFGCGFGAFAKILAERYSHVQVHGIDTDEEKITAGKKRYRLPNLHLLHSKGIIGNYDSVTAFFTLHEISNTEEILCNLCRHLNRDRRIMIYDFRRVTRAKYREWYQRGRPGQNFEQAYLRHNRWTVEEFRQKCLDAGLKTLRSEPMGDFWFLYVGEK